MLKIRSALLADIEALSSLESIEVDGFSSQSIHEEYVHSASTLLVAEVVGKIVGFLMYRKMGDEIEIIRLVVASTHRCQRVGSALLSHMTHLHPLASVFLEVRTSNVAAIALYKKMGFESFQTRKKYYRDGEDALVMKKKST